MKLVLVSDAWAPQVNGVVRTLATTVERLRARGVEVETVTPDGFATIPCPSYPEIRLALAPAGGVRRRLEAADPNAVHIATEGPLGWAARRWCIKRDMPFTTSFHTRFPEYVSVRTGLPPSIFWAGLRRFHKPARRVLVATPTIEGELREKGFNRLHRWTRGVDLRLFRPGGVRLQEMERLPGPVLLYVGRVAPEKNIEAFLTLETAGTKVVVGDGPASAKLSRRFPEVTFLGPLQGERLASAYRSADVFVFPSRTDTFGLVVIEALACGTPVAAYPVPGPADIIGDSAVGALDEDLGRAIERALRLDRHACAAFGARFDWEHCTSQFLDALNVRPQCVGADR